MTSQISRSGYPPGGIPGERPKDTGIVHTDALACAVYEQRESLLRQVAVLSDEQWDWICPAADPPAGVVRLDEPRRTVREVVAHLLLVDDMVLGGGALSAWAGLRRLEHPGAWDPRRVGPLAALPVTELVTLLARRGERFGRLVSGAPKPVRRLPVAGPFGRQPLAGLLARRVLHEWLHEQDIAGAGGDAPEPAMSPSVAAVATEALLRLLPPAVLPRTELHSGVIRLVVKVAAEGPGRGAQQSIWGLDFARRQYGPRVLAPADATIRVDAPVLAMVANGRGERLGRGNCVAVEGDRDVAATFLAALGTPRAPAPCLGLSSAAVAS